MRLIGVHFNNWLGQKSMNGLKERKIYSLFLFIYNGRRRDPFPLYSPKRGGPLVRSVYYYAVMFITLVMMIGGAVAAAMNMTDFVAPTPYYMSFHDYKMVNQEREGEIEKTDAQLMEEYELEQEREKAMERQRAINSLLKNAAWIVIPLPFFVIARRRASRRNE